MPRSITVAINYVSHTLLARNRKVMASPSLWWRAVVAGVVLATALVIVSSVMWAWSNLQYINLCYQISQAQEIKKQYLELNSKLRIELSSLTTISRLEKLAAETYAMSPPQPYQVVHLP